MIWVIAGTLDGRHLATEIYKTTGQTVFVSVVSDYGAQLAQTEGIDVYTGRLTKEDMIRMIEEKQIHLLVDASHPYAAVVSKTAREAAKEKGIPYIRYEREEAPLPAYDKLYHVYSELQAAELAGSLGEHIFLTTGSKTGPIFANAPALQHKTVWTRVLPTASVIEECERLGYLPKHIIAMQGPFSYELNKAMFQHAKANVVVMKNSGLVGGADTKLQAAIDLQLHIIVIDRPPTPPGVLVVHKNEEFFSSPRVKYLL